MAQQSKEHWSGDGEKSLEAAMQTTPEPNSLFILLPESLGNKDACVELREEFSLIVQKSFLVW